MFLALSPDTINTKVLETEPVEEFRLILFLVGLLQLEVKMAARCFPEPGRRGQGFFATLAKHSRVYQFNCRSMTVISRKGLEGKAWKPNYLQAFNWALKTSGIWNREVRDWLWVLTNSLSISLCIPFPAGTEPTLSETQLLWNFPLRLCVNFLASNEHVCAEERHSQGSIYADEMPKSNYALILVQN